MFLQLAILGVALGFNNALASVALGAMKMRRLHQLRTALIFAVFEAAMPVIGMIIGEQLANVVGDKARYIGIIVLAAAGLYSFFKKDVPDGEAPSAAFSAKTVLLAIALSLDNLSVGFGLGMLNVPVGLAALIFGCISLIMTFIGLEIGRYLGSRMSLSADKLSGIVLILTAGLMWIH